MRSLTRTPVLPLAALFAALLLVQRAAAGDGCTGQEAVSAGGQWTGELICAGNCGEGGPKCEAQTSLEDVTSYRYCGCFQGDFDDCCTVFLKWIAGKWKAKSMGTCTACGTTGKCTLYLGEPICKDPYTAVLSAGALDSPTTALRR
ncbi:MAG: hypothetical protein AAF682_29045 [Planctomycetota bacterium]